TSASRRPASPPWAASTRRAFASRMPVSSRGALGAPFREIGRRCCRRGTQYRLRPYPPPRLPPPRCWKQSEQYTGLSLLGWNGTCASLPQLEHVALNISRCPRPPPPP